MIFITGGKAQGKTAFAETLHLPVVDDIEGKIKEWMREGIDQESLILSKIKKEVEKACESLSMHAIENEIEENEVVLISREIGCGVIPVDKEESQWRELNGRVACILAREAKEVYKLESGIAVRIK